MKRITVTAAAMDRVTRSEVALALERTSGIEMLSYEEKAIAVGGQHDLLEAYSFGSLSRAAQDFVDGIWQSLKALWHMLSWSVIIIVSTLRWLWRKGVGKGDERG